MSIIIVNTGCSNLLSLKYAIERLGFNVLISSNKDEILHAKKVFIPGVGTSKSAIDFLRRKKIFSVIKNLNCPVLGICLGMQILCKKSEESVGCILINKINCSVVKFSNKKLPSPHIGWNAVFFEKNHFLFKNIDNGEYFYFLHGYFINIIKNTIAISNYGVDFSASFQINNFFGVQFHPEKSGDLGIQLIKNFLEI